MKDNSCQSTRISISRIEVLLLIGNALFFIGGIIYFASNWNRVPSIILAYKGGKSPGDLPKSQALITYLMFSVECLVYATIVVLFKRQVDKKFLKRTNISQRMHNANKQLLIEKICFLNGLFIFQVYCVLARILQIEHQIKYNILMPLNINNFIWLSFWVAIIINWLIHHVFWIELADK